MMFIGFLLWFQSITKKNTCSHTKFQQHTPKSSLAKSQQQSNTLKSHTTTTMHQDGDDLLEQESNIVLVESLSIQPELDQNKQHTTRNIPNEDENDANKKPLIATTSPTFNSPLLPNPLISSPYPHYDPFTPAEYWNDIKAYYPNGLKLHDLNPNPVRFKVSFDYGKSNQSRYLPLEYIPALSSPPPIVSLIKNPQGHAFSYQSKSVPGGKQFGGTGILPEIGHFDQVTKFEFESFILWDSDVLISDPTAVYNQYYLLPPHLELVKRYHEMYGGDGSGSVKTHNNKPHKSGKPHDSCIVSSPAQLYYAIKRPHYITPFGYPEHHVNRWKNEEDVNVIKTLTKIDINNNTMICHELLNELQPSLCKFTKDMLIHAGLNTTIKPFFGPFPIQHADWTQDSKYHSLLRKSPYHTRLAPCPWKNEYMANGHHVLPFVEAVHPFKDGYSTNPGQIISFFNHLDDLGVTTTRSREDMNIHKIFCEDLCVQEPQIDREELSSSNTTSKPSTTSSSSFFSQKCQATVIEPVTYCHSRATFDYTHPTPSLNDLKTAPNQVIDTNGKDCTSPNEGSDTNGKDYSINMTYTSFSAGTHHTLPQLQRHLIPSTMQYHQHPLSNTIPFAPLMYLYGVFALPFVFISNGRQIDQSSPFINMILNKDNEKRTNISTTPTDKSIQGAGKDTFSPSPIITQPIFDDVMKRYYSIKPYPIINNTNFTPPPIPAFRPLASCYQALERTQAIHGALLDTVHGAGLAGDGDYGSGMIIPHFDNYHLVGDDLNHSNNNNNGNDHNDMDIDPLRPKTTNSINLHHTLPITLSQTMFDCDQLNLKSSSWGGDWFKFSSIPHLEQLICPIYFIVLCSNPVIPDPVPYCDALNNPEQWWEYVRGYYDKITKISRVDGTDEKITSTSPTTPPTPQEINHRDDLDSNVFEPITATQFRYFTEHIPIMYKEQLIECIGGLNQTLVSPSKLEKFWNVFFIEKDNFPSVFKKIELSSVYQRLELYRYASGVAADGTVE